MLVALGVLLFVAGAILAFAVDAAVEGVDLVALGFILMGGGVLALVAAAVRGAGWMAVNNRGVHTERHVSDDGRHQVEDTRAV